MPERIDKDWRTVEILKLIRQCVICPFCGTLVATEAGIEAHKQWHIDLDHYVASVDMQLDQFSDYIINPETGLQKLIQDRLDTITNYVIAPVTGLEPRVTEAITQLRNDATAAIGGLDGRLDTVEDEIIRPTTGLRARLAALEALGL